MAAGRFDADVLGLLAGLAGAFKKREVLAANPYRTVADPAKVAADADKESKHAFNVMGAFFRQQAAARRGRPKG